MNIEKEIKALQKKQKQINKNNALDKIAIILLQYGYIFRWTQLEAFLESLEIK